MFDVVVVGGGVVGLTTAWSLARFGLRRVALVERGLAGSGNSGRGAGSVAAMECDPWNVAAARRTQALLAQIEAESGQAYRFWRTGSLLLAGRGQEAQLRRQAATVRAAGAPAWIWSADEARRRFPALNAADVEVGCFTPEDGVTQPASLSHALGGLCRAAGVEVYEGTAVDRLVTRGSRIAGVGVGDAVIPAPRVVVACGAWTRQLMQSIGLDIPLKAYRTQVSILFSHTEHGLPELTDGITGLYCVPKAPHSFLFGYGDEEDRQGPDRFKATPDGEALAEASRLLRFRLPGMDGVVSGGWAGLCDRTPDRLPLAGEVAAVPGLMLACGFGGYGITRGPATGEAMAAWLSGREPAIALDRCRPDRFPGWFDFPAVERGGGHWGLGPVRQPLEPRRQAAAGSVK